MFLLGEQVSSEQLHIFPPWFRGGNPSGGGNANSGGEKSKSGGERAGEVRVRVSRRAGEQAFEQASRQKKYCTKAPQAKILAFLRVKFEFFFQVWGSGGKSYRKNAPQAKISAFLTVKFEIFFQGGAGGEITNSPPEGHFPPPLFSMEIR